MTEIIPADLQTRITNLENRVDAGVEKSKSGFVQRNAPVISALAAVISLGLVAWFYVSQVSLTQRQLQNNLIYQMQKDQRTIVMDYSSGHVGPEYILAQMQSIFIQHNLQSIPNDVWPVFLRDFCSVMTHENFRRSWEDTHSLSPAAFSDAFVTFMGQITNPDSPECKEGRH